MPKYKHSNLLLARRSETRLFHSHETLRVERGEALSEVKDSTSFDISPVRKLALISATKFMLTTLKFII